MNKAAAYLRRAGALEEDIRFKQLHLCAVQGDRAAEITREMASLQSELVKARADIRRLIADLPNAQTRALLEMRYLSCMKWEDVSDALYVSPRTAFRRHQRALEAIAVLMGERG